jgi:hypothetical protein
MTYVDYIIIWGESNLDQRIPIASIQSGYNVAYTNVKYWNGLTMYATYTPAIDAVCGIQGCYSFDTYLLKMIADTLGITLRFVKHPKGATTVGYTGEDAFNSLDRHPAGSFNVNVYGSHYSALKSYILNVKNLHRMLGETARFRLVICNEMINDAYYTPLDTYVKVENGIISGALVDFHEKLKVLTGNSTLPMIHYQTMSTCTGGGAGNTEMITRQTWFDTYYPNSYLLRMNDNTARYPMLDNAHYNDTGAYNIAVDTLSIITTNNLLADWQ